MSLSRNQKKRVDMALARRYKYKNMFMSDSMGLECIALEQLTTAGGNAGVVDDCRRVGIVDGAMGNRSVDRTRAGKPATNR